MAKRGRPKKVRTPEEIAALKAHSNAWHKEWRDKNPERQQAILDRHYKKKAGVSEEVS